MLGDFGFAKTLKSGSWCHSFVGTPEYLAPEVVRSITMSTSVDDKYRYSYGKAVDYWGLGVFLYELLVGLTPFYSPDGHRETFRKIDDGFFTFPSDFDEEAKSLVKALLAHDPEERIGNLMGGISDIQSHDFFKPVDWKTLISYDGLP